MKPIIDKLQHLLNQVESAMKQLNLDTDKKHLETLEKNMVSADFWNDVENAEETSKTAASLRGYIENWESLKTELETTLELAKSAKENEIKDFKPILDDLTERVEKQIVAVKLGGEYDKLPAIMQLSAGVGGTDAADWTEMLEKMYIRYGEKAGFSTEILEESPAEEAGIKSATIRFNGPFAYGMLKSEKGSHRLVRLSPFNAQNLRQTSFALVDVIPEIPVNSTDLDEKDLKIDTYRASGHGGQSVNTTDSAVRVTHLPTGIVVAIQNERSQLKNRQRAISILASKLSELARQQHIENISELRGKVKSADWGSQIRSYIMHPYQRVKDHRTGYETSDVSSVLSGNIGQFIESYLNQQIGK